MNKDRLQSRPFYSTQGMCSSSHSGGVTVGPELEVPFAVRVSVVWLRRGDSACHQHRPDRSGVICALHEEPDCCCAQERAAQRAAREGIFTETAAPSRIGLS